MKFVRGVLGPSALLAALTQANPSAAQPFDSAGGGLFVGVSQGGVIWGFEGFGTINDDSGCSSSERRGYGPLARFTLRGLSRPSFTAAGFGVIEKERAFLAFGAEAGLLLAFPQGLENDAALSLHTGLNSEISIAHLFTWQEWMLSEFSVGGGVRIFPSVGPPGFCEVGRPQRDRSGKRVLNPAAPRPLPSNSAEALARDWADNARMEYASVPAFLQLAAELREVRAPAALVLRAERAAQDELQHTGLCAELAEHYTGAPHDVAIPQIANRPPLAGAPGLRRLAIESWLDGCLGEGLAAALSRDESLSHPELRVRGAQRRIAKDEHRHAELAWDILSWCLEQAEPAARADIASALSDAMDARLLPAPTWTSDPTRRAVVASVQRDLARRRLETLLH